MENMENSFKDELDKEEQTNEKEEIVVEKDKKWVNKIKEVIGGAPGPIREDLGSKKTVTIGDKEMQRGDTIYSLSRNGEQLDWELRGWGETGIVIRRVHADEMKFKERIFGGADEVVIAWDDLERFSSEKK